MEINFVDETEAPAKLIIDGVEPPLIIGTREIRDAMDEKCYVQISNICKAPGVEKFIIGADYHCGYGTIVGSTFSSATNS